MTLHGSRVVVLGAGLAGASSAYALAHAGAQVTLLEREPLPGRHASGRNAGLIRHVIPDAPTAALARRGAAWLRTPPPDISDHPLFRTTGSTLLAGPDQRDTLERAAADAERHGLTITRRPPADAHRFGLTPQPGGLAVSCAEDGVADPHEILSAFLAAARRLGVTIRYETPARLDTHQGRLTGVALPHETLPADAVVNAAGAWSADLARAAGALDLPLDNLRRHLFWTGALPDLDPHAPWVWDIDRGFYVRPESGGLLLCACDTDPRPPEDAQPRADASDVLAEKALRVAPPWADLPVARAWAGLRGFVPDKRFVIGPDPLLPNLIWATALGGHGVTTSPAIGQLVTACLRDDPDPLRQPCDPARLLSTPSTPGAPL